MVDYRDVTNVLREDGKFIHTRCIMRDITERRQLERRMAVHCAVTQVLAEANTLTVAVPRILQVVCETLGWDVGMVWEVDRLANALRCTQVWCAPSVASTAFEVINQLSTLAPGIGSPVPPPVRREPVPDVGL